MTTHQDVEVDVLTGMHPGEQADVSGLLLLAVVQHSPRGVAPLLDEGAVSQRWGKQQKRQMALFCEIQTVPASVHEDLQAKHGTSQQK